MKGIYICPKCGKSLASSQSLWNHKQRCRVQKFCQNRARSSPAHEDGLSTVKDGLSIQSMNNENLVDHQSSGEESDQNVVDRQSLDEESNVELESDSETSNITDYQSSGSESDDDTTNITDYTWHVGDARVLKNHSPLLPRDIRAIIVGKSGCGKTTLLTYLLLKRNMLDYNNLIVCGNSLHQPEYRILNGGFSGNWSKKQIQAVFKNQRQLMDEYGTPVILFKCYKGRCKGRIDAKFIDNVSEIPDPSIIDPGKKNVLVLDDIMLDTQNKAEAYYTRGRHNNVDVFYIAQSYFQLPRQTVRENANLFILFKQDMKNLSHIYNDHCAGDGISFETFSNVCNSVWQDDKYNYVTIDLTRVIDEGKYRICLQENWIPPQLGAIGL